MAHKYRLPNGTMWNITTEDEAAERLTAKRPDQAIRWLKRYRPDRVSEERWSGGVGEFVRIQIARITTLDGDGVRRYARVLAYLVDFCIDEGIELDVEEVLDPDTVDRFVASKNKRRGKSRAVPSSTRATWRSDLRRLGPALTSKAPWEPRETQFSRPRLKKPYTIDEIAKIRRDAKQQISEERSRAARAIVALGLGAGLDGRWNVRITHKHTVGAGPVRLRVPDPAKRLVVVRKEFEGEIVDLAQSRGPLVGVIKAGKNASSELAASVDIDRGNIRLNASRLRSTWLLALLAAGTPLSVVTAAAGLKTIGSIGDLLPYLRDPSYVNVIDADAAVSYLRKA